MYKALYLSPMIPSFDSDVTVNFFKELFAFSIHMHEDGYAILHKDNLTIHILPAGDIGEMSFYLEVDDIDELWNTIKDRLEGIKVRAPFDREYGMREFHIEVPSTKTLMFVGQVLKK